MAEFDDVTAQFLDFTERHEAILKAHYDFAMGTIDGGPNGDGYYPFPISAGGTALKPCMARIAFDARRVPRIRIAGSNSITLDPAVHQGAFLEITGGTASSNVTVNIPQSVPAEFSCMFAAQGSGRLIFDIDGDGFLRHDQGYDRTRGAYSVGGLYVASRDSSSRPTIYLFGSMAAA